MSSYKCAYGIYSVGHALIMVLAWNLVLIFTLREMEVTATFFGVSRHQCRIKLGTMEKTTCCDLH